MTNPDRFILRYNRTIANLTAEYADLDNNTVKYSRDKRAKLMRETKAKMAKAEKRLFESMSL